MNKDECLADQERLKEAYFQKTRIPGAKKGKQADLLLLERQGRPGGFRKLRDGRPLSFIKKCWPDIAILALSYAVFVSYIGWVVPSGIGILMVVIAWASCKGEE